jgi:hypothetical protein
MAGPARLSSRRAVRFAGRLMGAGMGIGSGDRPCRRPYYPGRPSGEARRLARTPSPGRACSPAPTWHARSGLLPMPLSNWLVQAGARAIAGLPFGDRGHGQGTSLESHATAAAKRSATRSSHRPDGRFGRGARAALRDRSPRLPSMRGGERGRPPMTRCRAASPTAGLLDRRRSVPLPVNAGDQRDGVR